MSYFSPIYNFCFLPVIAFIYNIFPKKMRHLFLLFISFLFFAFISKGLIIYLILSIVSVYLAGIILQKLEEEKKIKLKQIEKEEKKALKEAYKKKKKLILLICIVFNVAFLFFFKYLGFFATNTNFLMDLFRINYHIKIVRHIAPIGISFYTLEALSYVLDIYYGKIEADKNIIRVALYLSFFPQIMEGPIARYSDTANSLYEGNKVTYKNFFFGYQRILFGLFKKLIIADRLNIIVKLIFEDYTAYNGMSILVGIISYTIMLYMEFSGTMEIVVGTGEIFGVRIPENFRQPFFAKNISEFWTRWHISLGLWFKDYIFYPVSLSKSMKNLTGKAKKVLGNHYGPLVSGSIALFTVWLLNGLWHGAGWNFIFFGMYHFVMILMGNIFEPMINKVCTDIHIDRKNKFYRVFQSVKMTILVFIGELFFRAPTVKQAFGMLKRMCSHFTFNLHELFSFGLDAQDFCVLFIGIIIIFVISVLRENNINIRENVSKKNIAIRWAIYLTFIFFIILLGAYGQGYVPVDPIYADF